MRVQKRNGEYQHVKFDKITTRIERLCDGLSKDVDPVKIAQHTIKNIYDGVQTADLDIISSSIAETFKLHHPDYSKLASRLLVSNLHKSTLSKFSECILLIQDKLRLFSEKHVAFIKEHASNLDAMIDHNRDYYFDYFGYKTLEKSYLIKDVNTNAIYDRPQYIYMRVAIAISLGKNESIDQILANIKSRYNLLSEMFMTHATPTLFNSCFIKQQLVSCFLLGTEDSIEGIHKNLTNTALISKYAGGIGIHMSNIRSSGSLIRGTNGKSSGIVKQLKMYNAAARCWDQGGKRFGAFAIYLEPWHGDILQFLRLKLNQGAETERARDLFYALWIPDLFIRRVLSGEDWYLFSSDTAPGLSDVYDGMEVCENCNYCTNKAYSKYILEENQTLDGNVCQANDIQSKCDHKCILIDAFTILYNRYTSKGLAKDRINPREIFNAICESMRESGTPYITFKDHANVMSNQKNVGTIKSSNLCTEIFEWSSEDSYACCNLASINLKKVVVDGTINHEKLHQIVYEATNNLDSVIDANDYPVKKCINNSMSLRPIGIGIQGLADVFALMRLPFDSQEAAQIDLEIAETIYHAALCASCDLADKYGAYPKFDQSPVSRGILQPDLWILNNRRLGIFEGVDPRSDRYDWKALSERAKKGIRNSLLIANMPTVSTSQIMGNNESFEPFASNLYTKTTLGGKFTISNNHMIEHLIELGLWNDIIRNKIIDDDGSIQNIEEIPEDVRNIYKTVRDIKQSTLMNRAAMRSAFIDQGQSLNIYPNDNSNDVLRGIIVTGWRLGLKTGSYYVRTLPAGKAIKNNIAEVKLTESMSEIKNTDEEQICYMQEGCTYCSS